MRIESPGTSYLALPDGAGPHPGVVVIHEASGLNDNIRDICRRFAEQGYATLGFCLGGSWPGRDFTTGAAAILEAELTAAGIPHDLKGAPAPA